MKRALPNGPVPKSVQLHINSDDLNNSFGRGRMLDPRNFFKMDWWFSLVNDYDSIFGKVTRGWIPWLWRLSQLRYWVKVDASTVAHHLRSHPWALIPDGYSYQGWFVFWKQREITSSYFVEVGVSLRRLVIPQPCGFFLWHFLWTWNVPAPLNGCCLVLQQLRNFVLF